MGKFDQYILQNIQKEDINFESSQETKEELKEIDHFLLESEEEKKADQKIILMNQVNTLIGFLSQLAIRSNHPYLTNFVEEISKQQQSFIEQLNQAREIQDEPTLIQTLETLNATVNDYYNETKTQLITNVKNYLATIEERETLLKEVESLLTKIDQYAETVQTEEQQQMLKSLAELYVQAMQEDIHTYEGLQHEVALLKEWKTNATPILEEKRIPQIPALSPSDSKNFALFDSWNDQIVSYQSFQENGKTYVKYLLEDGKYYFAVVENKETVEATYKNFETKAQLSSEQTKQAWRANLETIVFCLQVYYILNEYVRYQEILEKDQSNEEKNEELKKYEKILSFMQENVLKPYLAYADTLSKQALIGENAVSTFYSDQDPSKEVTQGKVQELIVSVLGNQEAKKEIQMKQILETLYPIQEEDYLAKIEKVGTPMGYEIKEIAMTESKNQEEIPIISQQPQGISTNYDAMEKYFEIRKEALQAPLPEQETLAISKRNDNPVYKDVNLYLDLEEATQVTNLVYRNQNPVQGTNAKLSYLMEGNIAGFTSKYHARELASSVNRNEYFYQMLVQAIKDYATFNEQRKRNQEFGAGIENLFSLVGQEILEEQFNGDRLLHTILEEDSMLIALSKNFDGRYLIPDKGDEPLFQSVLKDYEQGNPMFADKVKQALISLRDQFKHEGYQVPTKSSMNQIQIPSGKVAE